MTGVVELEDLRISYRTGGEPLTAVGGVSLTVRAGETVALVGESGSGKSTLASAIIGLLPENARISGGAVRVDGEDVTGWPEARRRALRGRRIGLVPQDPLVSLDPTARIGRQIGEAIAKAKGVRHRGLDADVLALLEQVGIDRPELRARQHPHELSGGMRQRVLIAIALAGDPELLIADEPTSALDVTVQKRILDHLASLAASRGISLLLITHDLGVAADRADRIVVLKDGRVVEDGPASRIATAPEAAYTRALLDAAPAFATADPPPAPDGPTLLEVEDVTKDFALPRTASGERAFRAVDGVSLAVRRGETLGIVGESGSGKTTLLRIALGLEQPTSGSVSFDGERVSGSSWRALRPLRRRAQLVQQNPFSALDPRLTVFESVVEPLVSFRVGDRAAREERARELMRLVHLPGSHLSRLPRELSGGQRQRVAIARALALEPELVFLDEPVSALDVSVQAQILDLLRELQGRLGVAFVLVSHDLAVVSHLAHRVAVLRRGSVVESGPTADVFRRPSDPYTRELIAAVPGRALASRP
ncbi:dipeptide ABC transporter ATP-binding protein [Microbacterium sp. gxy059]|uniref:dipeptide ABC transporter ATP-binding protein n=1 Tax=Microbacterium sp. gxy059 TaxID=2957199 RepID=UPI003D958899